MSRAIPNGCDIIATIQRQGTCISIFTLVMVINFTCSRTKLVYADMIFYSDKGLIHVNSLHQDSVNGHFGLKK